MTDEKCVACGGEVNIPVRDNLRDYEYGSDWTGTIKACASCSLAHHWPMPTRDQALAFYPDEYQHYNPKPSGLRAFLMNFYIGRIVNTLRALGIKEGDRFVDVGSSAGEKLALLRDKLKLEVIGIEPNRYAVDKAREIYDLNIVNSTFPNEAIESGSADFVQINHVIEHDPDPVGLLNHIFTALKPGGWVVGETESIDCLSYRIFGRYWALLHMPYHLLFFTPKTLRTVFDHSHFNTVKIESQTDAPAWSLSIQNFFRRNNPPGAGVTDRIPGFLFLSMACIPISWTETGRGPILRFYARKPRVN
jgi:SAM-dependent methyltransferase